MNEIRRNHVRKAIDDIKQLRERLDEIRCDIDDLRSQEEDSYDLIPENLRETEQSAKSEKAIENFLNADNNFLEIEDIITALIDELEEITGD